VEMPLQQVVAPPPTTTQQRANRLFAAT